MTDTERFQRILDVKYSPADLEAEVNRNNHLSNDQKHS